MGEKGESVKDVITKLIEITKDTTFKEMTYQEIIEREKTILKQTKLGEILVSEIIEWIDAYEKPENKLHGITETIQQILKITKIHTDEKSNTVETLGNIIPIMITLIEEAVVDSKEPTTQVKKDIRAKLIHFIKEKTKTCCSTQISKLETWINEHEDELTPTELISGTINEMY